MGYPWAKDMEHVAFGMVSLTDGTLSTREGRVVFLEEVLNQAIAKTRAVIEEKNPDLENKDTVSRDVGVGAVVFSALSSSRIKDIVFDLDRVLNFDGETGPYVQYTHARARSLLRRAQGQFEVDCDYSALSGPQAFSVLRSLGAFPETIRKAADKNEPSLITRHVIDLAQAFNRFYYDVRVIDEEQPQATAARLALAKATAEVIKTGLHLIGLNAPDRM